MSDLNTVSVGLEQMETLTRPERVERLQWLAQFQNGLEAVVGRHEPLALLGEARTCYIYGLFIATLLAAIAFIEQTLVEELELRDGLKKCRNLQEFIAAGKGMANFRIPPDLLDQADQLRKYRNTYPHRKADDDVNRLTIRMLTEKRHPDSILEEDAQRAITVMYGVYRCTLR